MDNGNPRYRSVAELREAQRLQHLQDSQLDYDPALGVDAEDLFAESPQKPASGRLPSHGSLKPGVGFLLLCLLVSVLNWRAGGPDFAVSGAALERGEWWLLLTALFAHADMAHLLSNSLLIFVFGWLLRGYFGSLAFPWLSVVVGVLTNVATLEHYPPYTRLLGASGMLYAMVGMWLTIYMIKEREVSLRMRLLRVVCAGLLLLFPTQFDIKTSYVAHGYGFVFGLMAGAFAYFVPTKSLRQIDPVDA